MVEFVADKIDAAGINREDLVVSLYGQFETVPEIGPDLGKELM